MKTLTEFLEDDFNDLFDLINEGITDGRPEDIKQPWNDFETDDLMHFGDHYRKNILPYIDRAEKPFRKLLFSMKTDGGKVTTGRKSIEAERPEGDNPPLPTYHEILDLLCKEFHIPGSPTIWSAIKYIKTGTYNG